MNQLLRNLTDGTSYLTQDTDDPEVEGRAFYNAFLAIANILTGENFGDTDDHDPDLIDRIIGFVGYPGLEQRPYNPRAAASYIKGER